MPSKERLAERSYSAPTIAGVPLPIVLLAYASIAIYIAVMTLFKMSANDIWIHLKTGEYVLTHGWVPIKDPYSFIAADHDYVAHEWLSGVLFYLVYAPLGVVGLIFFKALVIAAACVLLLDTARTLGGRLSMILPSFTLLLYIASARYVERPHIFSYLMAAVYLWLFFRYRERGRRRLWLYLIPAAHVVWTNLHGGWVQGLAMVATFALGESLIFARARWLGIGREKAVSAGDLKLLWALVPACLAAAIVNPYGLRILTFPFKLTGLQLFMVSVFEWSPPYQIVYNSTPMFFFYLVQVGAICLTFYLSQKDRTRSRGGESVALANHAIVAALVLTYLVFGYFWFQKPAINWVPSKLQAMLFFLMGLFCLFTVVNLRSVDFTKAGLFAFFYLVSLRYNRAVTDAAMATFPILASETSALLSRRCGASARGSARPPLLRPSEVAGAVPAPPTPPAFRIADASSPVAVVFGSVLMLAVSAHVTNVMYYTGSGREKGFGITEDENMPTCAVDFIERNRITGKAFASYTAAAMLIHRMYPDVKVNMDSRNDVYGEDLFEEYLEALRSPAAMKTYLKAHPIDFFLLSYRDRLRAVFDDALEATGEWASVYYDDKSFVMVRRNPANQELVRREEYHAIRPTLTGGSTVDQSNAAQVLQESDRTILNCPRARLGYIYKSKALISLKRFDEAITVCRQALERDPRNPDAYAQMGLAYEGMKQIDKAIEMYQKAIDLAPHFDLASDNLRRLRGL